VFVFEFTSKLHAFTVTKGCCEVIVSCSAGTVQPLVQFVVVHIDTVPGDDRTMQTRSRLRRKLGQRKANDNNSNNSAQHTKISAPQKPTTNGLCSCQSVTV